MTITFGLEKKLERCLPGGERSVMICLAVSTQYRRVTDRRTDRQTPCDNTDREKRTSRAAKKIHQGYNKQLSLQLELIERRTTVRPINVTNNYRRFPKDKHDAITRHQSFSATKQI